MKPTIVIDANNACYRSLIVMGNRAASGHLQTGGKDEWEREVSISVTFGLFNLILRLAVMYSTNKFVFAWDSPVSHRKAVYPKYKSERRYDTGKIEKNPVTGRDLIKLTAAQFDYVKNALLPYIGFNNQFQVEGFEADDIIGQLVKTHAQHDFIVCSNDKDMFQLLDHCRLYRYEKHAALFDKDALMVKYGLSPTEFLQAREMAGDNSDCLEGIPGVAMGRATSFIKDTLCRGKAFSAIVSKEGSDIRARNRYLMELPFPGTPVPELVEDDLKLDKFLAMSNKFGFESFLTGSNLIQWRRFFDGFTVGTHTPRTESGMKI